MTETEKDIGEAERQTSSESSTRAMGSISPTEEETRMKMLEIGHRT